MTVSWLLNNTLWEYFGGPEKTRKINIGVEDPFIYLFSPLGILIPLGSEDLLPS